jgi:hypothetical protein
MSRLSKALTLSTHVGVALVVLALAGGITDVQANPTCTTTIVLPGGNGTVLDSTLTAAGTCVQSQDKLYGTFNFGTLPQPGAVTFGFVTVAGVDQHSITFSDPFAAGNTYTNSFEVQVIEGGPFPTNNFISQVRADVTQTLGGVPTPTTFTQTPNIAPVSGSINFTKTGNVVSGPFFFNYGLGQAVTDVILSSSLTTGTGTDVSAELNTIIETQQIPIITAEPAALELLGIALTGLALRFRRKLA